MHNLGSRELTCAQARRTTGLCFGMPEEIVQACFDSMQRISFTSLVKYNVLGYAGKGHEMRNTDDDLRGAGRLNWAELVELDHELQKGCGVEERSVSTSRHAGDQRRALRSLHLRSGAARHQTPRRRGGEGVRDGKKNSISYQAW